MVQSSTGNSSHAGSPLRGSLGGVGLARAATLDGCLDTEAFFEAIASGVS